MAASRKRKLDTAGIEEFLGAPVAKFAKHSALIGDICNQDIPLKKYQRQDLLKRFAEQPGHQVHGKRGALLELWLDVSLGRPIASPPTLGLALAARSDPYQTTQLLFRVEDRWSEKADKETMPKVAIEFLELVNPTITVSLSKHDYTDISFRGLDYDEKEIVDKYADRDYPPADWEEEGMASQWCQAVFGKPGGKAAWGYYLACLADGTWDGDEQAAHKKHVRDLWKGTVTE